MRRKRLAAKVLAVIMAISACMPMNSNTLAAYAAENADAVSAQEAESESTQEAASAVEEEPSAEEKETPAEEEDITANADDIEADETAEAMEESAPEEQSADSVDAEESYKDDKDEPQPSEEEESENTAEEFADGQGKEKQKELSEEEEEFLVTISLDANGGYFDGNSSQTAIDIDVYTLDDYCDFEYYTDRLTAPEGKKLLGWSTDQDAEEGEFEFDTYNVNEGDVYYAVWEDLCIITFDANGGYFDGQKGKTSKTVEIDTYDYYYDLYEINEVLTAPEGKVLKGWSKDKKTSIEKEYLETEELSGGDVYYAVWEDALIITLDANGGYFDNQTNKTSMEVEIDRDDYYYEFDDIVSRVTAPAGKALKGWSKDKGAKTGVDYLHTDDLSVGDIYYAVWVDSYTITLDANGGYFNDDPNVTTVQAKKASGDDVYFSNLYESASREGKKLIGWSTDKNADKGSSSTTVSANETYYAVWTEICIVTLDPNGGEFYGSDEDDQYISLGNEPVGTEAAKGANYYVSKHVRREGYFFKDWFLKDSGKRYNPYKDIIYKDTELIAKWEKAYKVTFDPNGGYYDHNSERSDDYPFWVEAGVKYVIKGDAPYMSEWDYPRYEEDGSSKKLIGWSDVKGGEPVVLREYSIIKDTTFYAVWGEYSGGNDEDRCCITFDANGGAFFEDETIDEIEVGKNSKFDWYIEPYNEDSSLAFGYWYLIQNGKEVRLDDNYVVTQDITVYAKWVTPCKITINAGDGYIKKHDSNSEHTLTISAVEGNANLFDDGRWSTGNVYMDYGGGRYISGLYDGLYEDSAFTKEVDPRNYTVSGDATLYVKLKPYYVVTLHGNGGKFKGKYRGGAEVTEDTIQLISIPGSSTMQLVRENSISGYFGYMQKNYDEPGSFLVKDSGEIFSGWFFDADCTEYAGFYQEVGVDTDIDLYAGYGTKLCTVKLDAGAGTIETGTDTFTVNESGLISPAWKAVVPNAPSGKVFSGWYLSKDCEADQRINDVASHVFTKDTTLYAGYADSNNVVTVRLDPNGGFYEDYYDTMNLTVLKGEALGSVSEPEQYQNLAFDGWYRDQACTQPIEDIAQFCPSGDCTLYAGWTQKIKVTIVEKDNTWTEYVKKNNPVSSINGSFISETDYSVEEEFISGYSLNKDLSGRTYSIKEMLSLPITKETTFYAVYSSAKKITLRCYANKQYEIGNKVIFAADQTLGDYSYENNDREIKGFLDQVEYRCRVTGKAIEGIYTDSKMDEDSRLRDIESYALEKDTTFYVNFAEEVPVKLVANGGYFENRDVVVYQIRQGTSGDHDEWYSTTTDKAAVNNLTVCKGSVIDQDDSIHVYHEGGLVLKGWYYDKACKRPAAKDLSTFVVNSGIVLYAKWGVEGEPEAVEISSCEITVDSVTYTGKALTPAVKVTNGDKALSENTDYKISFKNNINAGKGTVIVEGIGDYTGTAEKEFTINKAAQKLTAKAAATSIPVGKTTTLSVTGAKGKTTWSSANKALATVTGTTVKGVKVGTVKFKVTAAETDNYKAATAEVAVKILPAATTKLVAANQAKGIKLTWAKVAGANGYVVYRNNKKIKTITSGSTVTFTDAAANTNGTKYVYKVVAKATTGVSTLSKSLATYRVARPAITSLKNTASKKMTVKWGKNAKASGYQIQYSLKANFAGAKTVTAAKAATVSKVIGGLTKGKTYYVRIRTYKTVGKTKYYSLWSVAKKVKISK